MIARHAALLALAPFCVAAASDACAQTSVQSESQTARSGQSLTLIDSVAAALSSNPSLESARLFAEGEREARVQARADYLPQASLGADAAQDWSRTRVGLGVGVPALESEEDYAPSNVAIDLAQQVYTGGRRSGVSEAARARVASADAQFSQAEQEIVLAAIGAHAGVALAQQTLLARETYARRFDERVRSVNRQLETGMLTRTDLAQTLTRQAIANVSVIRARADLDNARVAYSEVTGARPSELGPIVGVARPGDSAEALIDKSRAEHPLVRQGEAIERLARAQRRIERSALMPQMGLSGRYGRAENAGREDVDEDSASVRLSMSVPLFEGGYAGSRMRQARLDLARAEADTEAIRRAVARDILVAWNNLDAAERALGLARDRESAAREALAGVERERDFGLRTVVDVLNAYDELLAAELAAHTARSEVAVASYRLHGAAGTLTPGLLSLPSRVRT